jgi:radical SAM superfamily enzyme YgiQ (UPF0313 family)
MIIMQIEQGPIRPPSEASSLLIRVTRNCPWNKCAFCITYKGEQFSRRPVEDVQRDIDSIAQVVEQVRQISWNKGLDGRVNEQVVNEAGSRHGYLHYHVAQWLYYGGKNVFLQDANSLVLKTSDLVQIIQYLRTILPSVERVTMYARANTVARKSVDELRELREAGFARIHMGMESGSDIVLKMIQKGITAKQLIEAAQKVKAAGISLCWYIMPGLGGREHSREHALGTAAVINQGNPDYLRFRTLSVLKKTPLYEMMSSGAFTPLDEDEVIREQRLLLESLEGVTTTVVSDHMLNLLQELGGTLPDDRDKMLGIIDRYLGMTPEEKANYQLGRRAGIYATMADMKNQNRFSYVEKVLKNIKSPEELKLELAKMRSQFM